jgi:hypothetical protein
MLHTNRRRRWHYQRRLLAAITGAILIWAGAHLSSSLGSLLNHRGTGVASDRRAASVSRPAHLPQPPSRPIYPYSVIRGGAYSGTELMNALDLDPVAARHYALFHPASVHTTASSFSEPVFLSYRVGNAIYWTSRPIRLPRGETLLTDGKNFARARCGNRISETPQIPVSDTEPEPSTLDQPKAPAGLRVANVDTWAETRLVTELAPPFAQIVPVQPESTSDVPGPGGAPQSGGIPTWWTIGPPNGFLYYGIATSQLSPNLPPPSTGGGTGPIIQPNPIPGLIFPPSPAVTPELLPITSVPSSPPLVAIIPPGSVPPGFVPPGLVPPGLVPPDFFPPPSGPSTPSGTPGIPVSYVPPGSNIPTDLLNLPDDLQPVPEPSLLPPTILMLAAAVALGLRRKS